MYKVIPDVFCFIVVVSIKRPVFPKFKVFIITIGAYAVSLVKNCGKVVIFFAITNIVENLVWLGADSPKVAATSILCARK